MDVTKRPFLVNETLYAEDCAPKLLEKLDDCKHPDLNSIDHSTLASLIESKTHPLLIIDSRFEYEFQGGHIQGAMNINKPEDIEEFFFKNKDQIE